MSATTLDDIVSLVDAMRSRKEEMTTFEGLLSEISVALADILAAMEKPRDEGDLATAKAITEGIGGIAEGLRALTIRAPDVQVHVPPAAVEVNVQASPVTVQPQVSVAAPQVTVQAPEVKVDLHPSPLTGWTLVVTSRDYYGNIESVSIKPEI